MGLVVKCTHCDVGFATGRDGLMTLLVCARCGTQHAIECAVRDRGPEFFQEFRITVDAVSEAGYRLVVQTLRRHQSMRLVQARAVADNPPFVLIPKIGHPATKLIGELRSLGVSVRSELVETRKNPIFDLPLQKDRLLYHGGPAFSFSSTQRVPEPLLHGVFLADAMTTDINSLQCQHCRAVGSLADELPEGAACPACSHQTLKVVSGWMS